MPHNPQRLAAYRNRPEMALAKDYLEALQDYVSLNTDTLQNANHIQEMIAECNAALDRPLKEHISLSDQKLQSALDYQATLKERHAHGALIHTKQDIDAVQLAIYQMRNEHADGYGMEAYFFGVCSPELGADMGTLTGVASLNEALYDINRLHDALQSVDKQQEHSPAPATPHEDVLAQLRDKTFAHFALHSPHHLKRLTCKESVKGALIHRNKGPAAERINAADWDLQQPDASYLAGESPFSQFAFSELTASLQKSETPHFQVGSIQIRHRKMSLHLVESDIYHLDLSVKDPDERHTKLGTLPNSRFFNSVGVWENRLTDGELMRKAHSLFYYGCPWHKTRPICQETTEQAAQRVTQNANTVIQAVRENPFFSQRFAAHLTSSANNTLEVVQQLGGAAQTRPDAQAPAENRR